jgi:galactokinase
MTETRATEQQVRRAFAETFGGAPRLFRAPGRINLIGEHTDYSDGFVFPAAIDRACVVAIAPNAGPNLRVLSLNRRELVELPPAFTRRNAWTDYVAGVRAVLSERGIATPGCDIVVGSDVPEGGGLSSSAALEVSVMSALLAAARANAEKRDIALWCQEAEVRFAGAPCGIMDQFVSVHARADHALLLDCRSLDHQQHRLPRSAAWLVIDSMVKHSNTGHSFQGVHADIVEAARQLGVSALRDADADMLERSSLTGTVRSRARHVIEENARALAARAALNAGDLAQLGRLMNASHAGLRDHLLATCPETDALAEIAGAQPGVHGARQMGGGFGGAVLALVETSQVEAAEREILALYQARTAKVANAFVCRTADGAGEIQS